MHGGHPREGHSDSRDYGFAFAAGLAVTALYLAVEAAFGLAGHSLSLLADAGHNLGDGLGLGGAWLASHLARRQPSLRYTYGMRRGSILSALVNAIVLLVITGGIAWEAIRRLIWPEQPGGLTMMAVAGGGIVVNSFVAWLFLAGRKGELNARATFLHMAADALVSLGVVIGGALTLLTGLAWIDPAAGLMIAGVIVAGTWSLLRESLGLALDGVPPGIDPVQVEAALRALPGVAAIHDLHIWAMSTTETALTAHLVRPDGQTDDSFLKRACDEVRHHFAIGHATFQVETGNGPVACDLEPDEVV